MIINLLTFKNWIPNLLRLSDPILIWCTKYDGSSMNKLFLKCKVYHKKQSLILIKTTDDFVKK